VIRYLAPLAMLLALAAVLAIGLGLDPRLVPSPLVGKPVPAFELRELREPDRPFASRDLAGEVSLLNVWASWCVGCREEHGMLLEIASNGGVPVYGLNHKDGREQAVQWLDRLGDPYRASGFDPDGRVSIDFGVYGIPETFVLAPDGTIAHKHVGPITPRVWERDIRPVVESLRRGGGR
jgi:cytochrome c biogenesis protein CcmG, thiol:disulfide interchange protein DsbE